MLGLLLTTRLRGLLNTVLKGQAKKTRKRFGLAGYLIIPLLLTFSVYEIFSSLLRTPAAGLPILNMLLTASLHLLLVFLLFSGLTVALHFFFLAKDFALLLSAPVRLSTLYQFKYIEALFANSSVFWALGLPMMMGYGLAANAPLWYYPLSLISALLFLALPTGLAALLSMALVRLIPAKRAKNIAALIVGLIFISAWVGFQFFRISRFDPDSRHFNPHSLEQLSQWESRFSFLPSDWLARSWQAAAQGDFLKSMLPTLMLLAFSSALYILGRSLMASCLAHTLSPKTRRVNRRSGSVAMPASFRWALIARDIKFFLRDSRQTVQLLMFSVIILVFPFITRQNMHGLAGTAREYMPFLYPLLLTALFSSTNAARMIPLEGLSFGLLKVGPQPFHRIVLTKNLLAAAFGSLCGTGSVLITAWLYQSSVVQTLQTITVLLGLNLGAAGLGGFFGAAFGKFDWEHPKRMLTGAGNLLLTLSSIIFFLFHFSLIFFGLLLNLLWLSLILVVALCLAALWLGTILAANKLDSMDWCF